MHLEDLLKKATTAFYAGNYLHVVLLCQQALRLSQNHLFLWHLLADALQHLGKYRQAIQCYKKALKLSDDIDVSTLNNLALAYIQIKEYDLAEDALKQCLFAKPDFIEAYINLSIVYLRTLQLDKAQDILQRAIALKPCSIELYNNLGHCLKLQGKISDAILAYKKAISLDQSNPHSKWNLSLCLLLEGRLKEGWRLYESRLRISPFKEMLLSFKSPPLTDEVLLQSLQDKTILVHAEQGHGDTIQFCRYMLLLKAKQVYFECQDALTGILKSLKSNISIISTTEPKPPADYECLLMSLPSLLQNYDGIGVQVPYLFADAKKTAGYLSLFQTLQVEDKFKVGIAWAGKGAINSESMRTSGLEDFEALFGLEEVAYFALMKTENIQQGEFFLTNTSKTTCYLTAFEDFADTAALIACLDLVISIDTAVAHLAGALGRETWVILPKVPDWRWQMHSERSNWYPTVRLFRQTDYSTWADVIQRIRHELQAMLKGLSKSTT